MPRVKQIDRWLVGATLVTAAFGVVMVASASGPLARESYHLPQGEFALRQLVAVVLGCAAMLAATFVPLEWLTGWRVAMTGLAGTWAALLLAFLQPTVASTHRWLQLPGISVQPSAIAKVTLPLALAALISRHRERRADPRHTFALAAAIIAVTVGLVLAEPDFGSAVLLTVAAAAVLVVAGVPWRPMLLAAAAGIPVFVVAIALKPYRVERMRSFFGSISYQVHQSLIALGRGGFLGQGPGESVQKLFYLPQPHTDFIFAIAGEELGFIGTTLILLVLGVIVARGLRAVAHASRLSHALVAAGLTTTLAVQALLNASVCLNLLPAKGLPLPLISAGGSDVVLTFAAIGLLLNIAKEGT
ncbi:MAG: FtsW/RodA/SpoVE family cell cycle protein [Acidobacteriota bacterium]